MTNQYDAEGRALLTVRTAYPDRAGIGDLLSHTTYDAAGRVKTTRSVSAGVHTFTYDAAGNRLSETKPGGDVLTMAYDPLGRVTKRLRSARTAVSTAACTVTWQSPWFTSLETRSSAIWPPTASRSGATSPRRATSRV